VSTDETFARYRLGRRLGRGGMAEVHEASLAGHDGFVRKVALKRVRRELAKDDELVRMFSDEARIASHLHHANLVAVLDYGVHEGVPYQALELVVGASLDDLHAISAREGRPIPEELAIHVAREVAHGLAYAHRAKDADGRALGLVHRDVSPTNVLVSEAGDVKLTDFGIAFAKKREVETAHGVTRGKPSYMAPEQATRGTLDARTDVFALGCTLHFALTGRSPLEGDAVLMKLLVGEPAPLDERLPDDLRALVAKAVTPDRRDRHTSAEAFAEALDAAYRRRSDRDGRAALRAWVAPIVKRLREDSVRRDAHEDAPRESAPGEQAHAARVADIDDRRTDTRRAEASSVASASRAEERDGATRPETPSAKTGSRAPIVIAALVTLAVGLVALEWYSLSRSAAREETNLRTTEDAGADLAEPAEVARPDGVRTPIEHAELAPDPGPREIVRAQTEPARAEPDDTTRDPVERVTSERGPRDPDERTDRGGVDRTTTAGERNETIEPRAREARAEGWARIVAGCDRARDGAVRIDGRAIGEHVPTAQRLAAGAHDVVVETASGERFEGTVEVTEFHTEGRPAWFRACQ
jgi:serine/threonine protein kinase